MVEVENRIILIGEHGVPIPQPKRKEDILWYDDKDPCWDRDRLMLDYRPIWEHFLPWVTKVDQKVTMYDQDGILISLNEDDSNYIRRIYEQETYRRRYGVHFKNGKDIEWLTGDHYFALAHCQTQRHDGLGDYFDYREFQRDFFYLIYLAWYFPFILGLFLSKAKKTGITNLFWLYYLNRATMRKNKNFGYMNLDRDIAAKTFCDYFLYAYNNLVPALRPMFKNKSEVEGSIKFGNQYTNSKKARMIAYASDNELNSSVFCAACKPKAFDVAVMQDIAFDEPTKYKEEFRNIWTTNKDAVKIQSKINGRAWLFNYTEGSDTLSFRQARDLFYDSERKTIKPGQEDTNSGLICAHVPAFASWEGAFDKYGHCDEKKAMAEIQRERDKVKEDPRQLQATTRQYANTKREAWGSAGAGNVFDPIRFGELMAELELDDLHGEPSYVDGYMEWENNMWNIDRDSRKKGVLGKVRYVELTPQDVSLGKKGKIRRYNDIPHSQKNLGVKAGKDENGCWIPPERFMSIMGADPTKHAAASEVIQGSKNAAYVINLPDEKADARRGSIVTNILQFEYYDRPEQPDEAFEDMLMLLIYTGSLAAIEANEPHVATRMMDEGLGMFMIVRDENGVFKVWERSMGLPKETEKKYNLIKRSANAVQNEMLETIVRLIKRYFRKPKPGSGEKDYGRTFKSERALRQIADFDATDTKLSDLVMALGWTLFGIDVYVDFLLFHNQDEFANQDNMYSVLSELSEDDD